MRPAIARFTLLTFATLFVSIASAQSVTERAGDVELKLVGGYGLFLDENIIEHGLLGLGVRLPVSERISIEPEIVRMWGPGEDRDWMVVPAFTLAFRPGRTVNPYVLAGYGWLRSTLPVGTGLYTFDDWTGGLGGGVRVGTSARTSLTIEGRVGSEPFMRVSGAFGIRLR